MLGIRGDISIRAMKNLAIDIETEGKQRDKLLSVDGKTY